MNKWNTPLYWLEQVLIIGFYDDFLTFLEFLGGFSFLFLIFNLFCKKWEYFIHFFKIQKSTYYVLYFLHINREYNVTFILLL